MKDKQKAKMMGTLVRVTSVLKRGMDMDRDTGKNTVIWYSVTKAKPRTGWVVGFRSMQEGYHVEGSYHNDMDGGYSEPGHLVQTGRVPCILVSYWPTMKPVKVPYDGYDAVDVGDPVSPSQRTWNRMPLTRQEEHRNMMKGYTADGYRDPVTGRFK